MDQILEGIEGTSCILEDMKEALALVWGVKKFHLYLFGRHFTLVTDHEPLTSILNPRKRIPAMTVARLQRYALFLAGFKNSIEYKKTTQHGLEKCVQQGSS